MGLEVTLLGPPSAVRDGELVVFESRKAMALLAHLALSERERSRDALCELLYPDQPPDRARGALRRTLSALRSGIGADRLDVAGDTVALRREDDLAIDVARFRALTAEGADVGELEAGITLFDAGFLAGFALRDSAAFDGWQMREADDLERELASALRRLVDQLAVRGEHGQAIAHAKRWLELDPLHEPAHRELIRLYAWSADRAAALEQYRACVRTLSQELGVAPLDETTALYAAVNEGTLTPPTPPPAPRHRTRPAAPAELPLVGRDEELARLLDAHAAAAPDGRLAVIEGEPGIGKTRLARELAALAPGAILLSARCHEDEAALPYGPVVELLRAAASRAAIHAPAHALADAALLLPGLANLRDDLPARPPVDGPSARLRLHDAVAAVITAGATGEAPGIVVVDDAHSADEATLDVLTYLGRRLAGRALLLVLTWRSEAVPPGHRLRALAAELARVGTAVILAPGRLDAGEVATLVGDVAPAEHVYLETEGLPLFVAEYLAAVRAGAEAALPAGILDARLAGLGGATRQALDTAATIGRTFDVDVLRRASGRGDEETVLALEELTVRGIVRESPSGYDFAHAKLRELVYDQTGLARRRLLHARVAAALGDRAEPAVLARHLRLAGDEAAAAEQHRRAGEHAAAVHAHAEASGHLEAALALGHPDVAGINERMGDLLTLQGDYVGALARYEVAAQRPEVEHKVGGIHQRRGDWAASRARFEAALARTEEPALRARIHADLAHTLHRLGEDEGADADAREALALAIGAGDRRAEAQAHNVLGVLWSSPADLERSLALARELADLPGEVAALNNLALVRRDAGDVGAAVELTQAALALCERYGDRHRQAALENNLADLHHAAGRDDEAMEHLRRAVTIFTEVEGDPATRQPAIWQLVRW